MQPLQPGHVMLAYRPHGRLQARAAGTGFGAPNRRCTDVLLALNVLCFGAQLLSKDAVMVWGAKVSLTFGSSGLLHACITTSSI